MRDKRRRGTGALREQPCECGDPRCTCGPRHPVGGRGPNDPQRAGYSGPLHAFDCPASRVSPYGVPIIGGPQPIPWDANNPASRMPMLPPQRRPRGY